MSEGNALPDISVLNADNLAAVETVVQTALNLRDRFYPIGLPNHQDEQAAFWWRLSAVMRLADSDLKIDNRFIPQGRFTQSTPIYNSAHVLKVRNTFMLDEKLEGATYLTDFETEKTSLAVEKYRKNLTPVDHPGAFSLRKIFIAYATLDDVDKLLEEQNAYTHILDQKLARVVPDYTKRGTGIFDRSFEAIIQEMPQVHMWLSKNSIYNYLAHNEDLLKQDNYKLLSDLLASVEPAFEQFTIGDMDALYGAVAQVLEHKGDGQKAYDMKPGQVWNFLIKTNMLNPEDIDWIEQKFTGSTRSSQKLRGPAIADPKDIKVSNRASEAFGMDAAGPSNSLSTARQNRVDVFQQEKFDPK